MKNTYVTHSQKWEAGNRQQLAEQLNRLRNVAITNQPLESAGKHVIDVKSTGTLHCHQLYELMMSRLIIGLVSYLFGLNTKKSSFYITCKIFRMKTFRTFNQIVEDFLSYFEQILDILLKHTISKLHLQKTN